MSLAFFMRWPTDRIQVDEFVCDGQCSMNRSSIDSRWDPPDCKYVKRMNYVLERIGFFLVTLISVGSLTVGTGDC